MTLNTLFDICPKRYPGYMLTSPIGGGSRTAATFKMELFVIMVNGFQPLTIITKSSILDVAAVLDPSLPIVFPFQWICRIIFINKCYTDIV